MYKVEFLTNFDYLERFIREDTYLVMKDLSNFYDYIQFANLLKVY